MSVIAKSLTTTVGSAVLLLGALAQSPTSAAAVAQEASIPCGHIWQPTGSLYNHCGSGSVIVHHRPVGVMSPYRSVCLPPGVSSLPSDVSHAYSDGRPC